MTEAPAEILARALAHHGAGELDAAEAAYRTLIDLGSADPAPYANLAAIRRRAGDFEAARTLIGQAIARAPDRPGLHRNLGNLLHEWGRLDEARAAYRAELARHPGDAEAQAGLARVALSLGDYAEGWSMYDHREARSRAATRGLAREWRGEPLAGRRLLIWPEQGFGDQILAVRFLPRLDAQVTMVCMPQLLRLFSGLPAHLIAHAETVAVPDYDLWALPLSLPFLLGGDPADLATTPYLAGTPRPTGGGGRVGVCWRGNARPNPGRSLPPDLAQALLALPGAVSLQPEDSGARDFQDTADLIAGLDWVVSIDTSVAHLAGAMGKPLLVLTMRNPPEWRWRTGADGRSVWYPSAEVLTQPTPGDWDSVIAAVKARWPA